MRQLILCACALVALAAFPVAGARAQTAEKPATSDAKPEGKTTGGLFVLEEIERQLRAQREEIEQLRAAVKEQSRLINDLRARVEDSERPVAAGLNRPVAVRDAVYADAAVSAPAGPQAAAGAQSIEARVGRVEEQVKRTADAVSRFTFFGDMRFRFESFFGQQNAAANPEVPGTLGNPLTQRSRLRLRARVGMRGRINDEFDWSIRVATGTFDDVSSTNQTLTDFFTRKPFAIDQAFFNYSPKRLPGFTLQAGKFDAPWTRTEWTLDNDITVEGLAETYTRSFKKSAFRNLTLIAWQLPMFERNSAFVLGADGRVDFDASGRAGRDLELYGAQVRTQLAAKKVTFTLSAADLYFSGTQFITPAQVFGANIQFPVTVVIPASGTTPARTVTTQVSIPRDLLVAGNANLGVSLANTNATNRDGRLSSGYNLVDLIARADFNRSKKWPVTLLFNFVTNTQTHDVVTAGASSEDVLLPNDQGQGFWAEFQIGKDVVRLAPDRIKRGDSFFNYTFLRAEKDAVLSPFNGSDFGQSTDVRVHRLFAGIAIDPRVSFTFTGFFTQRPTGLLGAFGQTPPGSLNRMLTRLQFDTMLRF